MHRSISFYDLLLFDQSKQIVMEGKDVELLKLLHDIGFDITKELNYELCYHRPMSTNQVFYGDRIVGAERIDLEWLESEYCTMENRLEIAGMRDLELQRDMIEMMQVGNWTAAFIEYIKD